MKIKLTPDKDIKVEKTKIGHIPVLILRPKDKAPARVGLLWIHGGGYILGMKEMVYMGRALNLVKKFGVTVLSPGYRLSWLKPYPAAVEDCYTVLRYMDSHKEELEIDRLMVGGESAGGGLCVAVCMMARDQGIRVSFQMPLYPMISNFDTESSATIMGECGTRGAIIWGGNSISAQTQKRTFRPMLPHLSRPITRICRHATPLWETGNLFTMRR